MGRNIVMLWLVVVCALSLVTSRHQARQTSAAIEREQVVRITLDDQYDRLRLEQSTFSTERRVDKLAREKLAMSSPTPEQIRVIHYTPQVKPLSQSKE